MDNFRQLLEQTELIADAIIKRMNPVDDDLSTNQAERMYGTGWLHSMVEQGKIRGIRIGSGRNSRVIFSRHELDTLRFMERQQARLIETK